MVLAALVSCVLPSPTTPPRTRVQSSPPIYSAACAADDPESALQLLRAASALLPRGDAALDAVAASAAAMAPRALAAVLGSGDLARWSER